MKPNPIVWFEIYVQDMARARRFYETVFQCTLEPLAARRVALDLDDGVKVNYNKLGPALRRVPGLSE